MEDYNEYESYDPYDAMPFGDAIRFEENQLASEHEYDDDYDGEDEEQEDEDLDLESRIDFADPNGQSALRAETPSNPRNLPCPDCGRPNVLTPADRARGYRCDYCAEEAEY